MGRLGGTELLLILLVVLLLFGAKRLPDLSRSLGRSLRILKSETQALHVDDEEDSSPRRGSSRAELASPSDPRPAGEAASGSVPLSQDRRDTR